MNRRFIGCIAALMVFGMALGAGAVDFPLTVSEILVEGTVEIRDREVLDVVFFKTGDAVNEADVSAAAQAILDLGWFSEVDPRISEDGVLTIHVVENPVVREIAITGNVNKRSFELFGIKLFELPIISTAKIRQILYSNDVRRRDVLNINDLDAAIQEIKTEYQSRGYLLVGTGEVDIEGETLSIEIIEGRIMDHVISGLETVPNDVVEELIDIPVGQPLLEADVQRVLRALNESIYIANVEILPQQGATPDAVVLLWKLQERTLIGGPVNASELVVDGITQFDIDYAMSKLGPLPDGSVNNYGLLSALAGLHNLYYRFGYIMVEFSTAGLDGETLHVAVDEGVVGKITVSGNTRTDTSVILRHLGLREGRVLTRNDLRVAHQQLGALGYFGSVNIVPAWMDSGEGVEISVTVTEKDNLGGMNGAIALDPSTGGLVGELTVNQKNLFGTGQDVSIGCKRGLTDAGEPAASTWNLGYSTVATFQEFKRVNLDLYQKTAAVGPVDDRTSLVTLGGRASVDYPVADYVDLSLAYVHEEEREQGESVWTPIDAISVGITFDDTDDLLFPTHGDRRRLTLEKAGGFAPGREYLKANVIWTHFTPVESPLLTEFPQVFAVRIRAAGGDQNTSESQTYTLGGPMTVRAVDEIDVQGLFVTNFEYRMQLADGLTASMFLDAGLDLGAVRPEGIVASTGFELGITAMGMLVRLDVAWMIGEDFTWTPRFDFGFGSLF